LALIPSLYPKVGGVHRTCYGDRTGHTRKHQGATTTQSMQQVEFDRKNICEDVGQEA
jgi:hypothetical protein